jgi:hypothetical protein
MAAVKEHHNHVTVIVLVFVPQAAQMVVRENAKDAKAVVKMDASLLVELVVAKDVKDVVMICAKAIVLQDVKLHVTVSVANRA